MGTPLWFLGFMSALGGFRASGFEALGFRASGFEALGFRVWVA